jgi:hypothetical protein
MKHLFRLAMLIALIATAVIGFTPRQEAKAQIMCDGLHVTSEVWNSLPNPVYRVNGNGPGLPSAGVAIPTVTWTTVSWDLYGPGTWDSLYLEYADGGIGPWTPSGYTFSTSCFSAGRDLIPLPDTAVVGSFTQTTPAYFEPQSDAASDVIFEAGKTAWVLGVDASGQFYKIAWSGDYLWVPVNTMGPNFDDVWNGTPLPGNVVE